MLPAPMFTPLVVVAPGIIINMFAPMLAIFFCNIAFDPWPISVMAMTAATAMMTPRAESVDRILLRLSATKAVRQVDGSSDLPFLPFDFAIALPRIGSAPAPLVPVAFIVPVVPAPHAVSAGSGCGFVTFLLSVSPSIKPSTIWIVRWAKAATLGSCVTRTTVMPSAFSFWNIRRISTLVCESRLPVGSSASTRMGRLTSERPIATRCCCPPDICDGS